MKLHSDREAFKEIISLAANKYGYEQSHVEKDYWISRILRDISLSEFKDSTYFKGGTSLSKAFGLINRFSEDLDLFVFTGDTGSSRQAEKTLNKRLSAYITDLYSDLYEEESSVLGGNYRRLCFSYDNVFDSVGLKEHLEVEIKSCDLTDKSKMFYPTEIRKVQPIVTDYLESIGRRDLITAYELDGFEMKCIKPQKTICDKISRLVKLSYGDDPIQQLAKYIRDIYDLTVICGDEQYREFINSEDFLTAMLLVTIEDGLHKNSRSHLSLAEAKIFKDAGTLMSQSEIKRAYTIDLEKLMFDKTKLPPMEEVVETLKLLHARLKAFEMPRANNKEL